MKALTLIFSLIFVLPIWADNPASASSRDAKKPHRIKTATQTADRPRVEGGMSPEASPLPSAVKDPMYFENHYPSFNGGWRWIYRRKAVTLLKDSLYAQDRLLNDVFKTSLNLTGKDQKTLLSEANLVIKGLQAIGDAKKAQALQNITSFYNDQANPGLFSSVLRSESSLEYRHLGEFLLGYYYEKMGFYPEAQGHYGRIIKETREGYLRAASFFALGRLYFLDGKLEKSKEALKSAVKLRFPGSGVWLANTLLVKGEVDEAWKIYSASRAEDLDPITALSLGDVDILMKKYGQATETFNALRARFNKDNFLNPFFALKSGDAFAAEGRTDEAIKVFQEVESSARGEGRAMALLSIADTMARGGGQAKLDEAEKLYREVAEGRYLASEQTYLSLVGTELGLSRNKEAIDDVDRFPARFLTSPLRGELAKLKGQAVYQLIDSFYKAEDYFGVINTFFRYGSDIPFGKKAEGSMKVGIAFSALELWPDAASRLDFAVKIGKDNIAEEAMIALGRVYMNQRDISSTERLLNNFLTRFPSSRYVPEARGILYRAAFMKEDYVKVADTRNPPGGGKGLLMKAMALSRLGRHKEALPAYNRSAEVLLKSGDEKDLVEAYLGGSDSSFMLGNLSGAVEGYRKAVEVIKAEDNGIERSWALYRLARSYSMLKKNPESREAVKDLSALNSEFGRLATPIFKEAENQL